MDGSSGLSGSASSRTSRQCGWARRRPEPSRVPALAPIFRRNDSPLPALAQTGRAPLGRLDRCGFGRGLLLPGGVLAGEHRVAVLQRLRWVPPEAARDVGHLLEWAFDLGEVAE